MIRKEHREEKWVFPFVEYLPSKAEGKLPLIIQLHGAGERGDGSDLALVDVHGFSKVVKDGEYECLFIMPQCPKDSFWVAKIESLARFIDQLKEEYKIDEDRVYLTGLSMGGYGTWYTAMAYPHIFAAIAPVCGGGMAWNAKMLTMPVRVFHGVDDNAVSVTQSDEMVEAIRKKEGDVTYTRMENVGHNVWEHAYNEELYNWLMSKKRENK